MHLILIFLNIFVYDFFLEILNFFGSFLTFLYFPLQLRMIRPNKLQKADITILILIFSRKNMIGPIFFLRLRQMLYTIILLMPLLKRKSHILSNFNRRQIPITVQIHLVKNVWASMAWSNFIDLHFEFKLTCGCFVGAAAF